MVLRASLVYSSHETDRRVGCMLMHSEDLCSLQKSLLPRKHFYSQYRQESTMQLESDSLVN